jgi:hypothetical protein
VLGIHGANTGTLPQGSGNGSIPNSIEGPAVIVFAIALAAALWFVWRAIRLLRKKSE